MRIAVRGDGIAAHLAALMLARAGQAVVRVPAGTGDHGLGPVGAAVLGLPDWQAGAVAQGIGWLPGSAFALGIAFSGWSRSDWFLPFGDTGAPLDGVPFPQVAARVRAAGHPVAFADFSLAALAARGGRFALPSPDPRSPLASLAIGVTYPADALAARLAALGAVSGVGTATDTDGADLIVEASGERSPDRWESWRTWLPCNRVAARRLAADRPPPPYPLHAADRDGWRAQAGLDGSVCEAAYSVDGPGTPYENGIDPTPWTGRRVAIGAAAGVIEPALGTPLLLAHDAVARLVALLPHDPADPRVEAAEYNRLARLQHEAARDEAVALSATGDRASARAAPPPALAHRLALYRSRGHIPAGETVALARADWPVLLDGQGIRPRRLDPLAAAIPEQAALAHLARVHDRLAATAHALPTHAEALARLRTRP